MNRSTTGHFWVTLIASLAMLVLFSCIGYIAITHLGAKEGVTTAMSVSDVSGFFGTFSSILAVIITILAIIITVIPLAFYFLNTHAIKLEVSEQVGKERDHITDHQALTIKSEVCQLEKEIRITVLPQLEKELAGIVDKQAQPLFQQSLEKYAAEQDRFQYLTELVLSNLWDKRATRINESPADKKLDTFVKEQSGHLKDTFTFTQLRSPEPKAIWTALSTLEHREDLPREFVKLICLLKKQERLKDEQVQQVAQNILQRFDKELEDC